MRQTYGSRRCSVLSCSTCRCPPVSWLSAEQHFGSITLQLPNGPFYFWPRMPDHLVGREHHEGSHLLLGELLVRQPGNGPWVGNASTALRVKPPLFLWISMDLQPQGKKKRTAVHATAVFICVRSRWPPALWRPSRLLSADVQPHVWASLPAAPHWAPDSITADTLQSGMLLTGFISCD